MKKNVFVILMSLLIGNLVLLLCCCTYLFAVSNQEGEINTVVEEETTNDQERTEPVLIEDGKIISGLEQWVKFLERSNQKKECEIEIVCKSRGRVYIEKKIQYTNGRYIVEEYKHTPVTYYSQKDIVVEEKIDIVINEYLYLNREYIGREYIWVFCNNKDTRLEDIVSNVVSKTKENIELQTGSVVPEISITLGRDLMTSEYYVHLSAMIELPQTEIGSLVWKDAELIFQRIVMDDTLIDSFKYKIEKLPAEVEIYQYSNRKVTYSIDVKLDRGQGSYGSEEHYELVAFGLDLERNHRSKVDLEELGLEETVYTEQQAIEDGCIVMNEEGYSNKDRLNHLKLSSYSSNRSEIRMISYKEGNIIRAMDVVYNRAREVFEVRLLIDENTIQEEEYLYLRIFSDGYVLTNQESLTEEDWKECYLEDSPGCVRTIFRE